MGVKPDTESTSQLIYVKTTTKKVNNPRCARLVLLNERKVVLLRVPERFGRFRVSPLYSFPVPITRYLCWVTRKLPDFLVQALQGLRLQLVTALMEGHQRSY